MANHIYPNGMAAFEQGQINLLSDTIKALCVTSGYTQSDAHTFVSDIGGGSIVVRSSAMASKSVTTPTAGVFSADPSGTALGAVASGSTITGVVIYKDTGVDGTSPLIGWYDTKADSTPISIVTNGGTITISWSAGASRVFTL